ncbi:hypothetical protein Plim_3209 [Planctopirus limnophila DSM 3776]|uniref:Uncharacterized protein n=1 Tax=Planctopirus limnophila (strain ATCC 43296 / DSM 3776 / IFAM 1008 / Mu 290) TaxID=521674 RepID=D5STJ4_PLAL2|nr:hypothetical protein [Planctopirus limnophila]ADG69023.1 hypothetical protein Plim_3209 [Planctopirus limnophila DSM 3776]
MLRIMISACAALVAVVSVTMMTHENRAGAAEEPQPAFVVECLLEETIHGKTQTLAAPQILMRPASTGNLLMENPNESIEIAVTTGTIEPQTTHQVSLQMKSKGHTLLAPRMTLSTGQTAKAQWVIGEKTCTFTCKVSKP